MQFGLLVEGEEAKKKNNEKKRRENEDEEEVKIEQGEREEAKLKRGR